MNWCRPARHRPLPQHAVSPRSALAFGVILSVASFAWLTLTVNLLSALLAASATRFPRLLVWGGAAATSLGLLGFGSNTAVILLLS